MTSRLLCCRCYFGVVQLAIPSKGLCCHLRCHPALLAMLYGPLKLILNILTASLVKLEPFGGCDHSLAAGLSGE